MDWTLAIERNREALKRILAMLVAMAGLGCLSSPLAGEDGSARRGEAEALAEPGEGAPAPTLPRHLHRAILRLLRPAESAARRLIIVMARGLVVTLPPARPREAKPASIFLSKPGGTGIYLPPGTRASALPSPLRGVAPTARTLALPLLDPLRGPLSPELVEGSKGHPRRPAANSVPRISLPGVTQPFPVAPRRPPAPDDPLDATHLALRLQALGAALDDLPRQAKRFARWKARKEASRDAAGAQNRKHTRRVWPLRPGRPPGQRRPNRRTHAVHEILNDLHGLAFDVLVRRDTS